MGYLLLCRANKEERAQTLAELYIIVDERSNEFEITDKGIQAWAESANDTASSHDFIMLDLGHEYAKIDENLDLSEEEKMQQKVALARRRCQTQRALPQLPTALPRPSPHGKGCRLYHRREQDRHHR